MVKVTGKPNVKQHYSAGTVVGDIFNLVVEKAVDNLGLAEMIDKVVGKLFKYETLDFHASRPAHYLIYALNGNKLKKLNFEYPDTFEEGRTKTVNCYLNRLSGFFKEAQKSKSLFTECEDISSFIW